LFALSDVGSDGLRRTLYRFGGHFQAGQNLHLFAASPACGDSRREFRILDIQFDIGGQLADAAVCA
jgi:hypothetical protein